jgi:hypothetical protein
MPLLAVISVGSAQTTEIKVNVDGQSLNFRVLGFESSNVAKPGGKSEIDKNEYDVIIVGGGMAGLCAAWYLRDKRIVVLERNDTAGGLAFRGKTKEGIIYARGSAYYSKPRGHVEKIYKELGLTPLDETAIPSPIDSFYYNGKLIKDPWEEEGLKHLPKGFRQFKEALLKADEEGLIPEQPIEEGANLKLDKISAAEFIKSYGGDLKGFLDSYGQSALGARTDHLNAIAFCNFYLAEIETRYAWPGGTAGASVHLIDQLNKHDRAIIKTGSTALRVKNTDNGVEVVYAHNETNYVARSKYAILAIPLGISSMIMDDYPVERKDIVDRIEYADYVVHQFFTSKDLFTDSYDTWFANLSFTDVITARWVETRGFKTKKDGPGILSVYQPLAPFRKVEKLTPDKTAELGVSAFKELKAFLPELANEKAMDVESYRWPASIHIVPPNYFSKIVPKLRDPVKNVYFAVNNLGTPSFEEALYRGWRAAQAIKKLLAFAPPKSALAKAA